MENQTTPIDAPGVHQNPERPVFLKVLCILSFIGTGLGILGGLTMIIGADFFTRIPLLGAMFAGGGFIGYSIGMLVANAIGFFGVLQMWKLKKTGFYLYIVHHVILIILPFILLPVYGFSFMAVLWPLIFIVLYGLNLKHLK